MQKEEKENNVDVDFTKGLPMEDNKRIIGHASFDPMTIKTIEGKIAVVSQMPITEANMALLTTLDNLPDSFQGFIIKLKPNTIALLTKKGSIYIEISLNILKSLTVFQAFLGYYHQLLAEFPDLINYTELYEATERCTVTIPSPNGYIPHPTLPVCYVTKHFYVVVHAETMIFDKLRVTLAAKKANLEIDKSMDYLKKEGVSDKELREMFDLDERSFYRWKKKTEQLTDTVSVTKSYQNQPV
jgi:hypothetical protein